MQLFLITPLAWALLLAPCPGQERVRSFDLLDNGDFSEALPRVQVNGRIPIPWWDSARGAAQLEQVDGAPVLRTAAGEDARQVVPLYAPLAEGLVLRGFVQGRGLVTFKDGAGASAALEFGQESGGFEAFEWTGAELTRALGHAPVPRLTLQLSAAGGQPARWRDLELLVPLPAPTVQELRAEILVELEWILALLSERGGDVEGEPTAFLSHYFDVLTGERLYPVAGMPSSYTQLVVDAAEAAPEREDWSAARERALDDFLRCNVHPESGLMRPWDCALDVPLNDGFLEMGLYLGLLLDVAEGEHEGRRTRARAALRRACDTILARGLAPDGEVIAKYRSSDGEVNLGYSALRRLDVPARLVRAAVLFDDARLSDAAREALANLEYSHRWAGTWSSIDPGFDDEFGHYGERALAMWEAMPDDPTFRRMALGGMVHFLPLWRDALRLGGNVAADQVRCWDIAARVAALEPDLRPEIARRLRAAVRVHVKGQQYDGGAWGDVTVIYFNPQVDLQVGDTFGPPQNLLYGLAVAYDPILAAEAGGPELEELRALFLAVLRSTRETYARPHGYLGSRVESAGQNLSGGSLRVATGLVRMLEQLR